MVSRLSFILCRIDIKLGNGRSCTHSTKRILRVLEFLASISDWMREDIIHLGIVEECIIAPKFNDTSAHQQAFNKTREFAYPH
jgi:hypothetical protein